MFQDLLTYLPTMKKAFVAAAAGFIVAQLQQHGFSPDMSLKDFVDNAVSALATGGLTWAVKNKR